MPSTPVSQYVLLNGVTTTATGTGFDLSGVTNDERNFVVYLAGTGAVTATVILEVSNNNTHWGDLATFTLSGTGSDTEVYVSDEAWQYVRGRVSAISGTGAAVTMTMGV